MLPIHPHCTVPVVNGEEARSHRFIGTLQANDDRPTSLQRVGQSRSVFYVPRLPCRRQEGPCVKCEVIPVDEDDDDDHVECFFLFCGYLPTYPQLPHTVCGAM